MANSTFFKVKIEKTTASSMFI